MLLAQIVHAGTHTSFSEIGDSIYITHITTDDAGNSFSRTQQFSRREYYAEMQRQWYNSLNPKQRMQLQFQNMYTNQRNAIQYKIQQDYYRMGGL